MGPPDEILIVETNTGGTVPFRRDSFDGVSIIPRDSAVEIFDCTINLTSGRHLRFLDGVAHTEAEAGAEDVQALVDAG